MDIVNIVLSSSSTQSPTRAQLKFQVCSKEEDDKGKREDSPLQYVMVRARDDSLIACNSDQGPVI